MTDIDGRSDFDFIFGRWNVLNRWRPDLDDDGSWVEFATTCEAGPILGGLGNLDSLSFAGLPGRAAWEGGTVRLYDPADGLWRIYWMSSTRPGRLDPPMEGRFDDGLGTFYGPETWEGKPVRCRFRWTHGGGNARWEQSFQLDDDGPWKSNWVMEFTPAPV